MDWIRNRAAGLLVGTFWVILLTAPAAQESRGTISGRVADASGGVLPGVTITVTNTATGSAATAVTNETGQFTLLYLTPSTYTVSAELQGFRKAVRERVEIRVGDRAQIDFTLEPGGITETVTVAAQSALLETGSATLGQVIDSKLIQEIPLGDGTAYGLTRLVGGATFERSYALQRPMDNDNLRGLTVSGTINSEFTIDGSSNVGSQARVAIQPPADAIQEFKVETAVYDAQIGHTGAGNVNLALRSGGNAFHGAASYYNRDDSRSKPLFASERLGTGVTPRDYNRFSATLSGPVIKGKTFFMGSYEKLQDDSVEAVTHTVPTDRMRTGDFSELLPRGIQIYDPLTAQNVNGVIVRQPFAGNIIPSNRINPIAANVLSLYPRANQAAAADLRSNYFFEQPWTYAYWFGMGRVDHEWSPDNKTYLRFIRNFRREDRFNWGNAPITRGTTDRFNWNWAAGHTAVLSPTLVLDLKGSWLRFNDDLQPFESFDPASLGYSQNVVALFGGYDHIPRFDIESGSPGTAGIVAILGGQQNGFNTGRTQPFYNVQFTPTLTQILGTHSIRYGYDWRQLRQTEVNQGFRGGVYSFDGTYTRSASNVASAAYGQGVAAFLLGIPSQGRIEVRTDYDYSVISHGFFIHDDWRVSSNLTLNLGLRYDYESGMTEKDDRNVRGFDLVTANPIQPTVLANYAALPPAGVPLSAQQFASTVIGGYTFASSDQRQIWDADKNNWQPRIGFTYKLGTDYVVRGGAGLFVAPFQIQGVPGIASEINQIGFSQNTPVPVTTDNGLTFQGTLSNPVPSGQLLEPVGSSLGLRTNLGGSPGTVFPVNRQNPQYWRYSLGIERELPWDMVVELSYLGQRGSKLPVVQPLNYVPAAYRTQSPTRDAAAETFLSTNVSNPFRGLFPDNPGSNGANIARRRLLLQYPQFDSLSTETYGGTNVYHGVLARLDKRFTRGLMIMSSYTWSRLRERVAPLNPEEDLEDRVSPVDRPHRFTFASVVELPFGRGRKYGTDWNQVVDAVLGGWQFSGKYEWQTGQPLTWGNVYYDPGCGDPSSLSSQWGDAGSNQKYGVDLPILDTSCFYTVNRQPITNAAGQVITFQATDVISPGAANIRRFPTTIESVRFQNHLLLDLGLTKNFQMGRARVQVRVEALNATNYTLFGVGNVSLAPTNASFGKVTNLDSSTVMKPRDIQLGVRVSF